MTSVCIRLRQDAPALDEHGEAITDARGRVQYVAAPYEDVDLDELSPRARALAEAIAAAPLATAAEIWVESDQPIRERMPDWEHWYSPERADQPERRPWRGWDKFRATSTMSPVDYLERQAAKIPDGWHVLGPHPSEPPVPTQERGEEWTIAQVVNYLATQGKHINASTWRGYVARDQAPQPVRKVGRTPLWDATQIRKRYAQPQ